MSEDKDYQQSVEGKSSIDRNTQQSKSGKNSCKMGRSSSIVRRIGSAIRSSMNSTNKIEHYVTKGNWAKLRKYLATEDGCMDLAIQACTVTEKQPGANCGTLLHVACQGYPPLDIVETLVAVNPAWITNAQNSHKHTPLHVAAAWGAIPQVVEFLTRLFPAAASMTDKLGRTPLHLHCEYCCLLGSCDPNAFPSVTSGSTPHRPAEEATDDPFQVLARLSGFRTHGPIPLVLSILHEASPSSINKEDSRGMNPIEYCLIHGASRQTIIRMQKMSVRQWRNQIMQSQKLLMDQKLGTKSPSNQNHLVQTIPLVQIDNQDSPQIDNQDLDFLQSTEFLAFHMLSSNVQADGQDSQIRETSTLLQTPEPSPRPCSSMLPHSASPRQRRSSFCTIEPLSDTFDHQIEVPSRKHKRRNSYTDLKSFARKAFKVPSPPPKTTLGDSFDWLKKNCIEPTKRRVSGLLQMIDIRDLVDDDENEAPKTFSFGNARRTSWTECSVSPHKSKKQQRRSSMSDIDRSQHSQCTSVQNDQLTSKKLHPNEPKRRTSLKALFRQSDLIEELGAIRRKSVTTNTTEKSINQSKRTSSDDKATRRTSLKHSLQNACFDDEKPVRRASLKQLLQIATLASIELEEHRGEAKIARRSSIKNYRHATTTSESEPGDRAQRRNSIKKILQLSPSELGGGVGVELKRRGSIRSMLMCDSDSGDEKSHRRSSMKNIFRTEMASGDDKVCKRSSLTNPNIGQADQGGEDKHSRRASLKNLFSPTDSSAVSFKDPLRKKMEKRGSVKKLLFGAKDSTKDTHPTDLPESFERKLDRRGSFCSIRTSCSRSNFTVKSMDTTIHVVVDATDNHEFIKTDPHVDPLEGQESCISFTKKSSIKKQLQKSKSFALAAS